MSFDAFWLRNEPELARKLYDPASGQPPSPYDVTRAVYTLVQGETAEARPEDVYTVEESENTVRVLAGERQLFEFPAHLFEQVAGLLVLHAHDHNKKLQARSGKPKR